MKITLGNFDAGKTPERHGPGPAVPAGPAPSPSPPGAMKKIVLGDFASKEGKGIPAASPSPPSPGEESKAETPKKVEKVGNHTKVEFPANAETPTKVEIPTGAPGPHGLGEEKGPPGLPYAPDRDSERMARRRERKERLAERSGRGKGVSPVSGETTGKKELGAKAGT
jgi:hypothetical protein